MNRQFAFENREIYGWVTHYEQNLTTELSAKQVSICHRTVYWTLLSKPLQFQKQEEW